MPGEEILELGRSKQRPAPPPRQPSDVIEPIHLDIQGQDEEEPPPPPRRVKLTLGVVVGVVSGLLAGAAGWNAIDDWRTETAAREATDLVGFLRVGGPAQDFDSVSATFTIFNSGEHPVTVEGISVTGWESRNADRDMSRDIDPGESALVQTTISIDCEAPPPQATAATHAVVDVRTADGQRRSVDLPFAQWESIASARDWICSPSMDDGGVWADLGSPEWGEGSVTLDMHMQSDREVTVVGVESTNPAFSVETTELPRPVDGPSGDSIATVWRVVDCVAAKNFESSGMLLRLTLDDGQAQEIDVSYGAGFGSLIRLTERSCPAP